MNSIKTRTEEIEESTLLMCASISVTQITPWHTSNSLEAWMKTKIIPRSILVRQTLFHIWKSREKRRYKAKSFFNFLLSLIQSWTFLTTLDWLDIEIKLFALTFITSLSGSVLCISCQLLYNPVRINVSLIIRHCEKELSLQPKPAYGEISRSRNSKQEFLINWICSSR